MLEKKKTELVEDDDQELLEMLKMKKALEKERENKQAKSKKGLLKMQLLNELQEDSELDEKVQLKKELKSMLLGKMISILVLI